MGSSRLLCQNNSIRYDTRVRGNKASKCGSYTDELLSLFVKDKTRFLQT